MIVSGFRIIQERKVVVETVKEIYKLGKTFYWYYSFY